MLLLCCLAKFFLVFRNVHEWLSQPKILGGQNLLILSEQQYVVRDTASQSTERQDMLEIGRGTAPLSP